MYSLLTTAVSALSPSSTDGVIPSPAEGVTLFAPTDDALLSYFKNQGEPHLLHAHSPLLFWSASTLLPSPKPISGVICSCAGL